MADSLDSDGWIDFGGKSSSESDSARFDFIGNEAKRKRCGDYTGRKGLRKKAGGVLVFKVYVHPAWDG